MLSRFTSGLITPLIALLFTNMASAAANNCPSQLTDIKPSVYQSAIKDVIWQIVDFANTHDYRLPLTLAVNERILTKDIQWEFTGRPHTEEAPYSIAYFTSTGNHMNRQIRHIGHQHLIYFKGALFINQYANTLGARGQTVDNKSIVNSQIWFEWKKNKFALRKTGASQAIVDRLFENSETLSLYRFGYTDEIQQMQNLLDPAKEKEAAAFFASHLDHTNKQNPTWFGEGRIHGYYYNSSTANLEMLRPLLEGSGRKRYRVVFTKKQATELIKKNLIWVDMEWADEWNIFSVQGLKALAPTIEVLGN